MTNVRQIIINSPKYGEKICLVDEQDYELVSQYKWVVEKGRTSFYAIYTRTVYQTGECTTLRMHQLVLGVKADKTGKRAVKIDHIDHNGLNNTRSNIRICTNSQNGANSRLHKDSTTGFKGVSVRWDRRRGRNVLRYCARIRVDGKLIELGTYQDKFVAAKIYNDAALKYFGDFAYLNEI